MSLIDKKIGLACADARASVHEANRSVERARDAVRAVENSRVAGRPDDQLTAAADATDTAVRHGAEAARIVTSIAADAGRLRDAPAMQLANFTLDALGTSAAEVAGTLRAAVDAARGAHQILSDILRGASLAPEDRQRILRAADGLHGAVQAFAAARDTVQNLVDEKRAVAAILHRLPRH